jgi:nitroimidazol reductase NimA-like FMN-containing flavoprotein (pyridoxamine 5'-phosphate oxidase superfamily)
MQFNKVIRGAKREFNDEESVFSILDSGFLCHVAFRYHEQTMMIPTAYGRDGEVLYLHGSTKNSMLNQVINGQTACITVTHLDGIVLAKTLFHTSVNYRSAVLFGKAVMVEDEEERMHGLKSITENIIKGRWMEVPVGTEQELKGTMLVKFFIESASAKMRSGGPKGDEEIMNEAWTGHIPLSLRAMRPVQDINTGADTEISKSVKDYLLKHT